MRHVLPARLIAEDLRALEPFNLLAVVRFDFLFEDSLNQLNDVRAQFINVDCFRRSPLFVSGGNIVFADGGALPDLGQLLAFGDQLITLAHIEIILDQQKSWREGFPRHIKPAGHLRQARPPPVRRDGTVGGVPAFVSFNCHRINMVVY